MKQEHERTVRKKGKSMLEKWTIPKITIARLRSVLCHFWSCPLFQHLFFQFFRVFVSFIIVFIVCFLCPLLFSLVASFSSVPFSASFFLLLLSILFFLSDSLLFSHRLLSIGQYIFQVLFLACLTHQQLKRRS